MKEMLINEVRYTMVFFEGRGIEGGGGDSWTPQILSTAVNSIIYLGHGIQLGPLNTFQ